ncbi:solute carrier family 22 member 13-like [Rhipicephalus sanguineus]|uniref:solute carrier family 22 member 13-like n=1 Tax=Rhipicephalus sanguineus TaxID=34632 RepID=UPI0020C30C18|nr:solute carrier family 22 member 13-like [Rhipicephalus sanguineus]
MKSGQEKKKFGEVRRGHGPGVPPPRYATDWFVPESTRWLLSKGKTDKAKKIMCTISKINGKDVDSKAIDSLQPPEKSDSATSSALAIFKYPSLRRSFVIMVLIRLIACVGNQVGQLYAAAATDDPFVMSSATNAVDVVGIWLAVPMADKFGRKPTAFCSYALACLFYLASGQVYGHQKADRAIAFIADDP